MAVSFEKLNLKQSQRVARGSTMLFKVKVFLSRQGQFHNPKRAVHKVSRVHKPVHFLTVPSENSLGQVVVSRVPRLL